MPATAFSRIGQIASMRPVHEAFRWLHLHERQIMQWQTELVAIAAPPFAEHTRATWLAERFRELGLASVHLDSAGNALGTLCGTSAKARNPGTSTPPPETSTPLSRTSASLLRTSDSPLRTSATISGNSDSLLRTSDSPLSASDFPSGTSDTSPLVLLSAHIDTVFSAQTPLEPTLDGSRLHAPGACDNGAGVVALLALAAVLVRTAPDLDHDIVFAGNVGEEGEGDLRGMRHIYESAAWRHRIAAHLVLDGAGHEVAVTGALGSRRFEVTVKGSGGHSWTDAGRPNPITALSVAIASMHGFSLARHTAQQTLNGYAVDALFAPSARPATPRPRSTWNVGTIEGGESVNAIPEQARARFDLRSTDADQLISLEVELHRAVEDAVLAANSDAQTDSNSNVKHTHPLTFTIENIGSRPTGALRDDARILDLLRSVDRHLNLRTEPRTASTDANIPLSLGIEAVSIGAGGSGGGIHTRAEWYDARGRDLGLRRVLLLLVALATSPS